MTLPVCTSGEPALGHRGLRQFFPVQAGYSSAMPLSSKDPETGCPGGRDLSAELDAIALRCAALPVLDERPEEEILGYDERGLPA